MWFIGVEVEQVSSAPPPEKILDPPLYSYGIRYSLTGEQSCLKLLVGLYIWHCVRYN